jgi:hypothetical protein
LEADVVSQNGFAPRDGNPGHRPKRHDKVKALTDPKVFPWVCAAWLAVTEGIAAAFDYHYIGPQLIFLSVAAMVPAIFWAAVPISALVLGVKHLLQHRYRVGIAWILMPAAAAAFIVPAHELGEILLFWSHKSSYDAIAQDAVAGHCSRAERLAWSAFVSFASCTTPVAVVIPWGEFVHLWIGIVYDPADEVAKPLSLRSPQWQSTPAGQALDSTYARSVRSLGNHYYLATGGCCFQDVPKSSSVVRAAP